MCTPRRTCATPCQTLAQRTPVTSHPSQLPACMSTCGTSGSRCVTERARRNDERNNTGMCAMCASKVRNVGAHGRSRMWLREYCTSARVAADIFLRARHNAGRCRESHVETSQQGVNCWLRRCHADHTRPPLSQTFSDPSCSRSGWLQKHTTRIGASNLA
jgi:hypothetical protein